MAKEFAKVFYRSKEWKKVREYVMKRDKYLCVSCGKPAEEVHHKIHLTPKNIYDPKIALGADNLIAVCRDCHFDIHREDHRQRVIESNKRRKGKEVVDGYEFDVNGQLIPVENKHDSPPGY